MQRFRVVAALGEAHHAVGGPQVYPVERSGTSAPPTLAPNCTSVN